MSGDAGPVTIAGVRVTSPDRILFGELGLTMEALARYYESVAEWMLPDLRNRPPRDGAPLDEARVGRGRRKVEAHFVPCG